ncbi:MAG TPA: hypothetical protein VKA79_14835 [Aestuariivirgaceae bacterium]|nr:hypothetical protein [Aestuariivirgaceae bacterium]
MNTTHIRYLAAAAAFLFSAMSHTAQSGAGGIDIGGVVGGTLGSLGANSGVGAKADAAIGYGGLDAKAKASVGGLNAKAHVGLLHRKKLYANAKLLLAGQGSYGKHGKNAKVTISLGGKTKVKGKLAAGGLASVTLGVNIGGTGGRGNNGTSPGAVGSTPVAMAGTFRDLSKHDQYIMTKKCSAVLAAVKNHDSDMVALCRIIATL